MLPRLPDVTLLELLIATPTSLLALTCKFATGVQPIPTKPALSIRIDSTPPSVKAIVSAAGKKIPVLVSPDVVMAGADTEPACTVVTPVADNVEKAPVLAVVAPIGVLLIEPPEITGLVKVLPVNATPVIVPPVILGAVIVYVPSLIPSPTSLIWDIISRIVSFTPDGNIPSGAPFGGAALLSAGVREYFVYAMIFLDYSFIY
jgi:hypothetical protein